jgi:CRISPR system Cascade subunit CasA
MQTDLPIWEREPKTYSDYKTGQERAASGFADLYTWQARAMRLLPLDNEKTAQVAFIPGIGCVESELRDPMVPYQEKKDKGIEQNGWKDRGFWRDFDSLLPDETHLAPKVIEHAVALTRFYPDRFPRSVMVLGQSNNKAKIEFWRMEQFVLPIALAGDKYIRSDIHRFLESAENAQKSIWSACSLYARHLLSRGDRKPEGKDINGFVSQMQSIPRYWSTLESKFHEILQSYTLDKNPDEIELDWLQAVRDALKDAWEQHRVSVSAGDAWAIRALVKAEGHVSKKIKELDTTIADFKQSLNKEDI